MRARGARGIAACSCLEDNGKKPVQSARVPGIDRASLVSMRQPARLRACALRVGFLSKIRYHASVCGRQTRAPVFE
jgi:hypothetical protein